MSDKQCHKLLSAVALLLGFLTLSPNINAQGQTANKISPSTNYSDNKLDFTLPFHLIDGYIFIDGQVNGKKGKFMFDTGTPFDFFLNHHFVPLAKDKYLSEGHAASGQFIVLHTQNRAVSIKLADQIQLDGLKSIPHSNFDFIQNNVVDKFLGMAGHGFNKNYLFIINYDEQTIDFHAFDQTGNVRRDAVEKDKIIVTLPFIATGGGKTPELDFFIGHEKIAVFFDTGNLGSLTLTQAMKTRLEQEGTLSVEEKNQLYEPHEPALYCTINKLRFENQALEDIHHVQLEIGKENKIGMGYQFLKNYVSVWNYKNQTITLLKR